MGLDEEVENIPVPGQGIRRVRNLPLISAIGFSGKKPITDLVITALPPVSQKYH